MASRGNIKCVPWSFCSEFALVSGPRGNNDDEQTRSTPCRFGALVYRARLRWRAPHRFCWHPPTRRRQAAPSCNLPRRIPLTSSPRPITGSRFDNPFDRRQSGRWWRVPFRSWLPTIWVCPFRWAYPCLRRSLAWAYQYQCRNAGRHADYAELRDRSSSRRPPEAAGAVFLIATFDATALFSGRAIGGSAQLRWRPNPQRPSRSLCQA